MVRANPRERLNIHQIVSHPVFHRHLEDFKKPFDKSENEVLIRNFILNLQGNINREVPEIIANELKARKSHSSLADSKPMSQTQSRLNFFDDIQEIKKSFFNDVNIEIIDYIPRAESKRNLMAASSGQFIPLQSSLYESNRSFFGNQIVPVVDDNFTCDFPSRISTREFAKANSQTDNKLDLGSLKNMTTQANDDNQPEHSTDRDLHDSNRGLPLFDDGLKKTSDASLFSEFVKKNTKQTKNSKLQSIRSPQIVKSANISEHRIDSEINRESIYHGKPVPVIVKTISDHKKIINAYTFEPKIITNQPIKAQNPDSHFQKPNELHFINDPHKATPVRVNNPYPNFSAPNNSTIQKHGDFFKKVLANESVINQSQIHLLSNPVPTESVLHQVPPKHVPYLISHPTQVHQFHGQKTVQPLIKTSKGFGDTIIRHQTDLAQVRIVSGPMVPQPAMRIRTLSASRLIQEPTSHIIINRNK
jgi:hypothetical protein